MSRQGDRPRVPRRAHVLTVGGATVDITPDFPLPTYRGEAPRRRPPRRLGLCCNAMVFRWARGLAAAVVLDTLAVERAVVLRIRDEVTMRLGIPGDRILVAATHSHATPTLATLYLNGAFPHPLYVDLVVSRTADALAKAAAAMTPVGLTAGAAATPSFAVNRRFIRSDGRVCLLTANQRKPADRAEGPVYPEMPFLSFEDRSDRPVVILMSIPCHNNCVRGGRTMHSDFFGRTRDVLREQFPTLQSVLIFKGPSGNVQSAVRGRGEVARKLGRECASAIIAARARSEIESVSRVAFAGKTFEIPDRAYEESTFCNDDCRGTTPHRRKGVRERYRPERAAVKRRGATSCLIEMQAMAFNDAALVSHPAELFSELGIRIRKRSPFATTLISGLTNGLCGYVPTAQAFEHGGYETHRSVFATRLARNAGNVIVTEGARLLARCAEEAGTTRALRGGAKR